MSIIESIRYGLGLEIFRCLSVLYYIVTGRPYPLRVSVERSPDGLPQRYEAAS